MCCACRCRLHGLFRRAWGGLGEVRGVRVLEAPLLRLAPPPTLIGRAATGLEAGEVGWLARRLAPDLAVTVTVRDAGLAVLALSPEFG